MAPEKSGLHECGQADRVIALESWEGLGLQDAFKKDSRGLFRAQEAQSESLAFPSAHPSPLVQKGLAPSARAQLVLCLFLSRCAVPAAPCWLPSGRTSWSLRLGRAGSLLTSSSHLWLYKNIPSDR